MKGSKGQAALEYILMLVVVVSIVTSLLVIVKRKYIGDPEKCELAINKKKIACKINSIITLEVGGGGKRYQYYPFKK